MNQEGRTPFWPTRRTLFQVSVVLLVVVVGGWLMFGSQSPIFRSGFKIQISAHGGEDHGSKTLPKLPAGSQPPQKATKPKATKPTQPPSTKPKTVSKTASPLPKPAPGHDCAACETGKKTVKLPIPATSQEVTKTVNHHLTAATEPLISRPEYIFNRTGEQLQLFLKEKWIPLFVNTDGTVKQSENINWDSVKKLVETPFDPSLPDGGGMGQSVTQPVTLPQGSKTISLPLMDLVKKRYLYNPSWQEALALFKHPERANQVLSAFGQLHRINPSDLEARTPYRPPTSAKAEYARYEQSVRQAILDLSPGTDPDQTVVYKGQKVLLYQAVARAQREFGSFGRQGAALMIEVPQVSAALSGLPSSRLTSAVKATDLYFQQAGPLTDQQAIDLLVNSGLGDQAHDTFKITGLGERTRYQWLQEFWENPKLALTVATAANEGQVIELLNRYANDVSYLTAVFPHLDYQQNTDGSAAVTVTAGVQETSISQAEVAQAAGQSPDDFWQKLIEGSIAKQLQLPEEVNEYWKQRAMLENVLRQGPLFYAALMAPFNPLVSLQILGGRSSGLADHLANLPTVQDSQLTDERLTDPSPYEIDIYPLTYVLTNATSADDLFQQLENIDALYSANKEALGLSNLTKTAWDQVVTTGGQTIGQLIFALKDQPTAPQLIDGLLRGDAVAIAAAKISLEQQSLLLPDDSTFENRAVEFGQTFRLARDASAAISVDPSTGRVVYTTKIVEPVLDPSTGQVVTDPATGKRLTNTVGLIQFDPLNQVTGGYLPLPNKWVGKNMTLFANPRTGDVWLVKGVSQFDPKLDGFKLLTFEVTSSGHFGGRFQTFGKVLYFDPNTQAVSVPIRTLIPGTNQLATLYVDSKGNVSGSVDVKLSGQNLSLYFDRGGRLAVGVPITQKGALIGALNVDLKGNVAGAIDIGKVLKGSSLFVGFDKSGITGVTVPIGHTGGAVGGGPIGLTIGRDGQLAVSATIGTIAGLPIPVSLGTGLRGEYVVSLPFIGKVLSFGSKDSRPTKCPPPAEVEAGQLDWSTFYYRNKVNKLFGSYIVYSRVELTPRQQRQRASSVYKVYLKYLNRAPTFEEFVEFYKCTGADRSDGGGIEYLRPKLAATLKNSQEHEQKVKSKSLKKIKDLPVELRNPFAQLPNPIAELVRLGKQQNPPSQSPPDDLDQQLTEVADQAGSGAAVSPSPTPSPSPVTTGSSTPSPVSPSPSPTPSSP